MTVSRSQQGPVTILSLQGALIDDDLKTFDDAIDECLSEGMVRIALDMRHVPFIDSAGLEKLQHLVFDMGRRGGDVRVANLNDICRDIFLTTRMESFIQVFSDRESAVRSLS